MKRKLLTLAIGSALALPLAAQAAPTVYGQLDLSVDGVRTSNPANTVVLGVGAPQESWQVNSNASRLGIMGEEALGDGLTAIYKIEYGVSGDTSATPDLVGRDRFVGLKGNFGTVRLGAFNSPLKAMQGQVDQFLDMRYADMSLGMAGLQGYNRMNNAIGYTSPKMGDVTVNVLIQPGETDQYNNLVEAYSTSVDYNANGTYLGLGYDSETSNGAYAAGTARDNLRLAASQTMDNLKIGALLQVSELSNNAVDAKQTALIASAAYTHDKHVFKAQLASVKNENLNLLNPIPVPVPPPYGTNDEKRLVLTLGADHNFTKTTKAYGQLGFAKVDNLNGLTQDAKNYVMTVGMQTKF